MASCTPRFGVQWTHPDLMFLMSPLYDPVQPVEMSLIL